MPKSERHNSNNGPLEARSTNAVDSSVFSDKRNVTVPIRVLWLPLLVETPGASLPWLGPAIRGMILQPLRDHFCLLSDRERDERQTTAATPNAVHYCRGCTRNATCAYGRAFEPDRLMIEGRSPKGMRDGLRGISLAPEFPTNLVAASGDGFLLRLLGIGAISSSMLDITAEAIDALGATKGLGPDNVKIRVDRARIQEEAWHINTRALPQTISCENVPFVRIVLETPLFLKSGPSNSNRRFTWKTNDAPTLASLLRESIRTVRRAVDEYNECGFEMTWDPRDLLTAAENITCESENWTSYEQSRTSSRQNARWIPSGWHGSVVYRDVPVMLLPWLVWGGRLGVGDSRNCGAGLWHVVLA